MIIWIITIAVIGGIVLFIRQRLAMKNIATLSGKHVMITGGSSGIGKAIANNVVRRGASVSLIARNQTMLDEACHEVQRFAQDSANQRIQTYSVDISNNYQAVEEVVKLAMTEIGPINLLINCAGTSVSYKFEDTPLQDFQRMLNVNYMGSVHATKAVISSMKERKEGRIVFISSIAGLLGLYGYTAYSASKFALLGLAESLHMELKPYNVGVTVAFPPDTDTPGFKEEEKTKPLETRKISESGGLYSADAVAEQIIKDTLLGKFSSVVGIEGVFISTLCSGVMPVSSAVKLVFEVVFMGIFRLAGALFLFNCNRIIKQCTVARESGKKMD